MKVHCLIPLLLCSCLAAQEKPATLPVVKDPAPVVKPVAVPTPLSAPVKGSGIPSNHSLNLNPHLYPYPWIHQQPPVKPAVFYSSRVEMKAGFSVTELVETAMIDFQIMQGEAEKLTVEVLGNAPVLEVKGEGLKSWSFREEGKSRFLDFVPANVKARTLKVTAVFKRGPFELPVSYDLSTFGPGGASGFSATYTVSSAVGLRHRLLKAEGLVGLER